MREKEKVIKVIEELSLNSWPSLQTIFYDGWVLRFANGFTKRSNSISPFFSSGLSPEEKIRILLPLQITGIGDLEKRLYLIY